MCFLRKNSYLVVLTSNRLEIWVEGGYYKYLLPKKFGEISAIEPLQPIKNQRFQKKIHFSALLYPISMKFGGMMDIIKI